MFEESIHLREVGGIVGRETGCVKGVDEKLPPLARGNRRRLCSRDISLIQNPCLRCLRISCKFQILTPSCVVFRGNVSVRSRQQAR